ncbi:LodA/GoxA family CTQ-dependent oxidase [Aureisphaera galaxeae]|uniref:LodA/GoxA family CTQ-dependent oxidase n=1 Tax=Aureisphaera galaxeae TaxID=1538023 RepID=UPI0023508F0B|nr:LodA/GoxA family CTQ-dependent oxidase [Aureisphaera galaxeae]MDC8005538.1 LodA/GoxA family CTQ-dependent oxidase [Aureisphaera galaxeae]
MSKAYTTFKIHPGIGFARLGNTEDDFYLCPEQLGELPIACNELGQEKVDANGNLVRVSQFKDSNDLSKIKKQAARFKIFAYSDKEDEVGEEIKIGGTYDFIYETAVTAPTIVKGKVTDIDWTVHLANKKASWYEFQETNGMHGYEPSHPLRNPEVTQPDLRRQLIIDPGPLTVSLKHSRGEFAKFGTDSKKRDTSKFQKVSYPQTFPPSDIKPNPIDTLGSLIVNEQDKHCRLIVLGGNGNSGSTKTPVISNFVNNNGWFDDISDGPVTATIQFSFKQKQYDGKKEKMVTINSSMDVQVPAWVVVGYPRYAPQMQDMITMDEKMYDLFVRKFAYDPQVFGVAPYDKASNSPQTEAEWETWRNDADYNPDYYPKFYKEIWTMLHRPDSYRYSYDFDYFAGSDPHNRGTGGNLDENALSQVPKNGEDPYFRMRQFIYMIMRQTDERNDYVVTNDDWPTNAKPRLMPMLCGNNPLSNVSPDKFLSMTETQLFFLKQWMKGKFVNECEEWNDGDKNCKNPWANPPTTGVGIDRGVLSNILGGAFCPGGEISWIVNNPAIYSEPYRIKHATYLAGALSIPKPIADIDGSNAPNLAEGMEPGDMTKFIGIPWQADFHECTTQDLDVTYRGWNNIYLDSDGDPAQQDIAYDIPWWPAHRPIVVSEGPNSPQVYWASGIPANNAGDLQMVEAWKDLGFLLATGEGIHKAFYQQERNNDALGDPVTPGDRVLGQSIGKSTQETNNN